MSFSLSLSLCHIHTHAGSTVYILLFRAIFSVIIFFSMLYISHIHTVLVLQMQHRSSSMPSSWPWSEIAVQQEDWVNKSYFMSLSNCLLYSYLICHCTTHFMLKVTSSQNLDTHYIASELSSFFLPLPVSHSFPLKAGDRLCFLLSFPGC